MKKTISVFIDESGNFDFKTSTSKYYILTLIFHDQSINLKNYFDLIKDKPVFHAGPLIRNEQRYKGLSEKDRFKAFHDFFLFTTKLPIKCKCFCYEKYCFDNAKKLIGKLSRDILNFYDSNLPNYFNNARMMIYYDNGQKEITNILESVINMTNISIDSKPNVTQQAYRLAQVADFISELKLLEFKQLNNELTSFESKFINKRLLKNTYLRYIKNIEIK
ncbi:MAG: DUF3800 domain-containing protein [Bacilli bacterium]|nr:DUF3800 domain-containing protein [Bacilli bacterium]